MNFVAVFWNIIAGDNIVSASILSSIESVSIKRTESVSILSSIGSVSNKSTESVSILRSIVEGSDLVCP